jgi:hypothetical protein
MGRSTALLEEAAGCKLPVADRWLLLPLFYSPTCICSCVVTASGSKLFAAQSAQELKALFEFELDSAPLGRDEDGELLPMYLC